MLVCHGYSPDVSEWLNEFRITLLQRGVRFWSISFERQSVEQLLPFLRFLVAFWSSNFVIGLFKMPRSGGSGYWEGSSTV